MSVQPQDLFITGDQINQRADHCYIAMFMHDNFNTRAWIVGSLALNHYYTVFDMTPHEERQEGFIQVGMGERNIIDKIGTSEDITYKYSVRTIFLTSELLVILAAGPILILLLIVILCMRISLKREMQQEKKRIYYDKYRLSSIANTNSRATSSIQ